MVDSGDKGFLDYLNLLEDEEDSDNDDVGWKRKKSPSSTSSPPSIEIKSHSRNLFDNLGDNVTKRLSIPSSATRAIDFDEMIKNNPITRTITRTIEPSKPSPVNNLSPVKLPAPPPSKVTPTTLSPSESVWKRLTFPVSHSNRDSPQPSTSTQRANITPIKPPPPPPPSSSSSSLKNQPSTPTVQRKSINPPSSNSSDIRVRLGSNTLDYGNFETPVQQQRPPIPDNLNFKAPFAPARPKYHSERDIDLPTFVKQLEAEMLFHQSLDRIYNRSMRELSAMRAIPELESLIKRVIEGVLFDPEVQLTEETVHKILKILDMFDLDNSSTWTFLIDQCYTLVTKNTEAHYLRMAKFIEMSFNHLFNKKIRLLPATALSIFKLAQVRPFDPEKKPSARVKLSTIKADLSGINKN